MSDLFVSFLSANPTFGIVLSIVGALRILVKPIMTALYQVAKSTTTPSDDRILDDIEKSKVFQSILWVLDYLTSIKISR